MKLRVVIDRIEDGRWAVLEIEGMAGDFIWPVAFLPKNIRDGSILDFIIEENPSAEKEQRDKMRELQEELLERTRQRERRDRSN